MKKLCTSHISITIGLLLYGFFMMPFLGTHAFADNNVFGLPTTFESGTGLCDKKIEAIKASVSDKEEQSKQIADIEKTCYEFLEPLPTTDSSGNPIEATTINITPTEGIGVAFNSFYDMAIALGSVLAVVMIVIYGYRYMVGEKSGYSLEKLKGKITNVVLGILLLLGIYVILNTINPRLLEVNPDIRQVKLNAQEFVYNESSFEGDGDFSDASEPGKWGAGETLPNGFNITCPGSGGSQSVRSIVSSFEGKVTYRFNGKGSNTNFTGNDAGKSCPSGTICLDCSGFINQIHKCAGIPRQGTGTANIFGQGDVEKIKTWEENNNNVIINNKELKPGDVIGQPSWHVFIYVGNGEFADVTADNNGRSFNRGLRISTKTIEKTIKRRPSLYLNRI